MSADAAEPDLAATGRRTLDEMVAGLFTSKSAKPFKLVLPRIVIRTDDRPADDVPPKQIPLDAKTIAAIDRMFERAELASSARILVGEEVRSKEVTSPILVGEEVTSPSILEIISSPSLVGEEVTQPRKGSEPVVFVDGSDPLTSIAFREAPFSPGGFKFRSEHPRRRLCLHQPARPATC
ncbi:hypothetical protein HPQ61_18410 [Acetobacteraceae bacterium]|nr:hypothetical protein [Acetobacteraceae bacterium]